jgi:predicted transcriptional regulator
MTHNLKELTASIVASYVESNKIAGADLPSLIQSIYTALSEADHPPAAATDTVVRPTAAQIRKSITPDALISFIDKKPYRMLKRHLTTHGLTAKGYQERYGLPSSYPMTAPTYSAARSALATKMGLGRKAAPAPAASPPTSSTQVKAPVSKPRPGEKAGPGARVPKAVRSTKGRDVIDGVSS